MPVSSTSEPTIPDEIFLAAMKVYIEDSETEMEGENGDSDYSSVKTVTANLNRAIKGFS